MGGNSVCHLNGPECTVSPVLYLGVKYHVSSVWRKSVAFRFTFGLSLTQLRQSFNVKRVAHQSSHGAPWWGGGVRNLNRRGCDVCHGANSDLLTLKAFQPRTPCWQSIADNKKCLMFKRICLYFFSSFCTNCWHTNDFFNLVSIRLEQSNCSVS